MVRILLLLMICGCTANEPSVVIVPPEMVYDVDDAASIQRWEQGEYNFHSSKVVPVTLKYLHSELGGLKPKVEKRVGFEVWGAVTAGVSLEQQLTIDELVADEAAIHKRVRAAIYQEYQRMLPALQQGTALGQALYGDGGESVSDVVPVIKSGNEIDGVITLQSIHIHPPQAGTVSIGIVFSTPWTDSGIGVRVQRGQVIAVGEDTAAW